MDKEEDGKRSTRLILHAQRNKGVVRAAGTCFQPAAFKVHRKQQDLYSATSCLDDGRDRSRRRLAIRVILARHFSRLGSALDRSTAAGSIHQCNLKLLERQSGLVL